jgi:hypothetical protein
VDYLRVSDLDGAFDQLRVFTFSEAMLHRIAVYLFVGTPVAITLVALEYSRVRWLQGLMNQRLGTSRAARSVWWLEQYLRTVMVMLTLILMIGPCHLELPVAHYLCAGAALFCGATGMCLYLIATADLGSLIRRGTEDQQLLAWTDRVQNCVRPVLKAILLLHVLALLAGAWKSESLGDDGSALLFGVLETSLILGYQLFQAVFVVDDVMVGWKPGPSSTLGTQQGSGDALRLQPRRERSGSRRSLVAKACDDSGVCDKLLGS